MFLSYEWGRLIPVGIYPGEHELEKTLSTLKSGSLADFLVAMRFSAPEDIPLLMDKTRSSDRASTLHALRVLNAEHYRVSHQGNMWSTGSEGAEVQKAFKRLIKDQVQEEHGAENKILELTLLFFFTTVFIPITYWFVDSLIGGVVGWEDSSSRRVSEEDKKQIRNFW